MNINSLSYYENINYYEGDTAPGYKIPSNTTMRDIIDGFLQKCGLCVNTDSSGAADSIYSLFLLLHKIK
jgi:hypothetical protein